MVAGVDSIGSVIEAGRPGGRAQPDGESEIDPPPRPLLLARQRRDAGWRSYTCVYGLPALPRLAPTRPGTPTARRWGLPRWRDAAVDAEVARRMRGAAG